MSNIDDVVANAIDPEIIYSPADLEALDPEAVVLDQNGDLYFVREYLDGDSSVRAHYEEDFPAVKVADGAHLRACLKALGEGDDG